MKEGRSGTVVAAVIFAAFIGGFVYRYWPNEERDIRRHLSNLAEALSLPAAEGETVRLTRFAALREYFATDVRVSIDGRDIESRDAVIDRLGRVSPPPGGLAVEVVDVRVTLAEDQGSAQVDVTAKVSTAKTPSQDETLETRRLDLAMLKWQGDWVISSVVAAPQ